MQINTLFLKDTFSTFAPDVDTKFTTFTDMKNLLKTKYSFKGKLTKKDITDHFEKIKNSNIKQIGEINIVEDNINKLRVKISKKEIKPLKELEKVDKEKQLQKLKDIRK